MSKFNLEMAIATAPSTPQLDLFSCNRRLARYVKVGDYGKTIDFFQHMQREGLSLNTFSYVPVLNACANLRALEEGRYIHRQILENGCESNVFVSTCLVDMYAKCGSIDDALTVFNKTSARDVACWNAMIRAYVRCGQGRKALELSWEMAETGVNPNAVTFVGLLNACASAKALEEGRSLHKQIMQNGWESNILISSSLVDMYAKCRSIEDAWTVFNTMPTHDLVAWNTMIRGCVKCGEGQKALELFLQMRREGMKPNTVTFLGVLNACASVAALEEGRRVHEEITQSGFESNILISSSLVDMYAKCGNIEDASKLFGKMSKRDVIAWTAIIRGHVQCGQEQKALEFFWQMHAEGVEPNPATFVAVMNACANVAALEEGRRIHEEIIESGYESNIFVSSCLVDMYAKCGSINNAWEVFKKMPMPDVVAWNAMIMGCAKCGEDHRALDLYRKMQQEGIDPSVVTFLAVLNVCASIVALEEGRHVHQQIIRSNCESDIRVGNALIDMYAKCGSIGDAWKVFNHLPTHTVVSWTAMLGGYAMHGHAKEALEHFKRMCQEGVHIDGVTFLTLLTACSHGGLVDDGLHYFESSHAVHKISVTVDHYACIVDLLGRAGRLHEAESLIKLMPFEPNASIWMCLLGACRARDNVEMGERVAKQVLELDPGNIACYVLLSSIYAASGKWDIQRKWIEGWRNSVDRPE